MVKLQEQDGGVRQVVKPRKSESDKVPVKPTAEDIEEFREDKKEKQSTAVAAGAKKEKFRCYSLFIR